MLTAELDMLPLSLVAMQGWESSALINADTEEQHMHERKAFTAFFSQENITAVAERLVAQVEAKCKEVGRLAALDARGEISVDMAQVATEIVAAVVQEVRVRRVLVSHGQCPNVCCECQPGHF